MNLNFPHGPQKIEILKKIRSSSCEKLSKKISPQKVEKRLSYGPIIDSAALHGVLQYCRAYVCFVD